MINYISEQWNYFKEKYIDEFSQIRRYSDGQMEIIPSDDNCRRERKSQSSSITCVASPFSSYRKPPPAYKTQHSQDLVDVNENELSIIDWEKTGRQLSFDSMRFSTFPMRRLSVPPSVYSRIHRNDVTVDLSSATLPPKPSVSSFSTTVDMNTSISNSKPEQCIADPLSEDRILVPYKYPHLASILHWVLVHCGFRKKKPVPPVLSQPYHQHHQLSPIPDSTSNLQSSPSIHPLNHADSVS